MMVICIQVLTLWLSFGRIASKKPSEDPMQCCQVNSIRYEDLAWLAQCEARCYKKWGEEQQRTADIPEEVLIPPECKTVDCLECLKPCKNEIQYKDICSTSCTSYACQESCEFLSGYKQTNPVVSVNSSESPVKTWTLSRPKLLCRNSKTIRKEHESSAEVVLMWQLLPINSSSGVLNYSLPIVFILQIRNNSLKKSDLWGTLGMRKHGLIPVTHLKPNQEYQFRLTAVTPEGVFQTTTSDWIATLPSESTVISPPANLWVHRTFLQNGAITSVLKWKAPEEYPCFYKVYWLPNSSVGSSGLTKLSKPYQLFEVTLPNLRFQTNYTVIMISSDATFRKESEKTVITILTPSCLEIFTFNFSVCAPGPPRELRIRRSYGSSSTHVVWKPPAHTSQKNRVLEYQVVANRQIDINETPHTLIKNVNETTHRLPLHDLKSASRYTVSVAAVSEAGRGDPAVTHFFVEGTGKSQNSRLTIITLSTLCGGAVLCFLISIILLRRKKISRRKFGNVMKEKIVSTEEMPIFLPRRPNRDVFPRKKRVPHEVDLNKLRICEVIGHGAFGVVCKGSIWIGKVKETVAVKMTKDCASDEEKEQLIQEIELLKFIGKHPQIVSLRGFTTTGRTVALMVEYCPLGDLHSYLLKLRNEEIITRRPSESEAGIHSSHSEKLRASNSLDSEVSKCLPELSCPPKSISPTKLLSYSRQIALGMEFLASHKIVHRDLAARNILMYDKNRVKITDFGLSRDVYEVGMYEKSRRSKLPVKWMAIEAISHQTYTTKSDMWSFGVLLWEICSLGATPYPGVANHELLTFLETGHRLEKPKNCSEDLYQLMISCWSTSPVHRPTFLQMKLKLETMLEDIQTYVSFNNECSASTTVIN
ncbi:tyrosine-protein kinase receptor torso-like [Tachypleus tridentatus]|uniref:tyrosine-protein kinase receptor torso-like n=1 Tax=Tachypleus tridentatus TaxID=6853 RepID=UPI003FD0915F